jgi:hypothetical protein
VKIVTANDTSRRRLHNWMSHDDFIKQLIHLIYLEDDMAPLRRSASDSHNIHVSSVGEDHCRMTNETTTMIDSTDESSPHLASTMDLARLNDTAPPAAVISDKGGKNVNGSVDVRCVQDGLNVSLQSDHSPFKGWPAGSPPSSKCENNHGHYSVGDVCTPLNLN